MEVSYISFSSFLSVSLILTDSVSIRDPIVPVSFPLSLSHVIVLLSLVRYESILFRALCCSHSEVNKPIVHYSLPKYRKNLNNWTVCYEVQNSLLWKGGKNTAKTRPLPPSETEKKTKIS